MLKNVLALLASVLLVSLAASFGALYGPSDWYFQLHKPFFNPPNWIFGPVWSFLYLSMAVAAWLVWLRRNGQVVGLALALFGLQLLLNALWTWLFFGLHWMGVALADILVMEALILLTGYLFWRINHFAGLLFVPYALWVGFASILNMSLWSLNA